MEEALKLFNNYYDTFDKTLDGVHRKYDHTMRVVILAKKIAKGLNLNDEDYELASLCALYHDIARFKQWSEYKTFEDALSFDHGNEGESILKELGINDDIILKSTRVHNKISVPTEFDERTKMFCDITRDADKLDNLCIKFPKLDGDEEIPEEAVKSLLNKEMVKNNKNYKNNKLFHLLREIGFIFDLNFKESFKIIRDDGCIERRLEVLNDSNIKDSDEIKRTVNEFIEERLSD
ncbi:MAG: HD domain-containing protein [Bacilli bacterium]|nr:HD domain-containing protein [Bacilli bacterium]